MADLIVPGIVVYLVFAVLAFVVAARSSSNPDGLEDELSAVGTAFILALGWPLVAVIGFLTLLHRIIRRPCGG